MRRLAIFLEQSIYNGIQWAVFEPNDEDLWASLRLNIGAFMMTLFRAGAFQGAHAGRGVLRQVRRRDHPAGPRSTPASSTSWSASRRSSRPSSSSSRSARRPARRLSRRAEEEATWPSSPSTRTASTPTRTFKFQVKIDNQYVAGLSKCSALQADHRGDAMARGRRLQHQPPAARARPSTTPSRSEAGVTHDTTFEDWANLVNNFQGDAAMSLKNFRKDIIIDVYNEAGQKVISYKRLPLLGVGVPGAARARRRRQRRGHPAHQARERGLGARRLGDRADRELAVAAYGYSQSSPEAGSFVLPGGFVDAHGVVHRQGRLRPPEGRDEQWLLGLPASARQARVVTELLRRCVRAIGPYRATRDMMLDLGVGDREYLLLALRRAAFGDHLALVLTCPRQGCGKPMDAGLDLDVIPVAERPVGRPLRLGLPVAEVEARLPSGRDQEAIADLADHREGGGATDRAALLLDRCILGVNPTRDGGPRAASGLGPAERAAVAEAIEQAAPGPAIDMEARCPECGHVFSALLDTAALVLDELRGGGRALDEEIDLLAFHYHWSLRELLGLSRPRRQRFVRLVHDQLSARAG